MKDTFSTYHPINNFWFFTAVLLFSMFFLHPVFLGISLFGAVAYSIQLNGKKAVKFNLLMLPILPITVAVNALFNHYGVTILFYLFDNPVTLEAIVYGAAMAVMFLTVLIWFSCYNAVMTSDKFIYLFGRIIPSLSLIITMVLRFVPKYKAQLKLISNAQKCVGRDVSQGNLFRRIKNGLKIISILITWALENAIETSDSMRSRGYGLRGRTAFSNYRFDRRDLLLFVVFAGLTAIVLTGSILGETGIIYNPAFWMPAFTPFSWVVFAAYLALTLVPVVLNFTEAYKWRHSLSKI